MEFICFKKIGSTLKYFRRGQGSLYPETPEQGLWLGRGILRGRLLSSCPKHHTIRHVHARTAGMIGPILTGREMTDSVSHSKSAAVPLGATASFCQPCPIHSPNWLTALKAPRHCCGPAQAVAPPSWVSSICKASHYDNLAPSRPDMRKAEGSSLGIGDRSQQGIGPEINKRSRILSSFWRKMRNRFRRCDLLQGKIMFPALLYRTEGTFGGLNTC